MPPITYGFIATPKESIKQMNSGVYWDVWFPLYISIFYTHTHNVALYHKHTHSYKYISLTWNTETILCRLNS